MAESTLSVTYADLKESVAHYLGYGRTSGNWSTRQSTNIDDSVNRGLNEFYYHAMIPNTSVPHKWSFLNPRANFTIWPTTTGTVDGQGSYSDPLTTIDASAGTFYPSMEGKTFTFDTSGTGYTISQYVSATQIKVVGDASSETNNDTFTITADGDYTLPQDFQSIEGPLTFTGSTSPWVAIDIVGEAEIREDRSKYSSGGIPVKAAIDPLAYDSSSAQRWQVMVFPTPSVVYTLKIRYSRAPDAFTADTDYPPGGAQYTECVRLMCEAAAEKEVMGQRGPKYADSRDALARAVMADTMNSAPEHLGMMTDYETIDERDQRFVERRWSGQNITTNF